MTALAISQLTEKQAAFVKALVGGASQGKAAEQAGYSHPDQQAFHLVRHAGVARAIQQEITRRLETEGAPLALHTLIDLLGDKHPGPVRLGAAKTLLDRAGHIEKRSNNSDLGKSLSDMSEEELFAQAGKIRAQLEQRDAQNNAPILDATPASD